MRTHPVVVHPLAAGEAVVLGDEAHHLGRVLRVRPGDRVRALDGAGLEAHGEVVEVSRDAVLLQLDAPRASDREPGIALTLGVSLLKGDKLADVVRMGTELGVREFALFSSARAEPDALSTGKRQRLERVAREAAKQSGRAVIPAVVPGVPLADLPLAPRALVADPRSDTTVAAAMAAPRPAADREGWPERANAATAPDREAVAAPTAEQVTAVTGPEGGFTGDEVDLLVERGATAVSLGRTILRAETAPVVLAALVLLSGAHADGSARVSWGGDE